MNSFGLPKQNLPSKAPSQGLKPGEQQPLQQGADRQLNKNQGGKRLSYSTAVSSPLAQATEQSSQALDHLLGRLLNSTGNTFHAQGCEA